MYINSTAQCHCLVMRFNKKVIKKITMSVNG